MDPLSATASIVNVLDTVTRLSKAIHKFRHNYALADEDLIRARSHALLLKAELKGLEATEPIYLLPSSRKAEGVDEMDFSYDLQSMSKASFERSLATARDLLLDIEASFPLRTKPHTWASKVRWAAKDKSVLEQLKVRLQSTESTLQGILSMEQLRVSRLIYSMLERQQAAMTKIEKGEITGSNIINVTVVNKYSPETYETNAQPVNATQENPMGLSTCAVIKPPKYSPWEARINQWGVTAKLVTLTNDKRAYYRGGVQLSILDKLVSVQMELSFPTFSFTGMLYSNNVVPVDSKMAIACKSGDFHTVRHLLANREAHGSDSMSSGWPVLDVNTIYLSKIHIDLLTKDSMPSRVDQHVLSPLQASFLRGRLDIARILLNKGADIEYVDNGGYSVLSYLWVVDSKQKNSLDFMGLCQAHRLSEVNACDDRGWTALHRAAAIGTSEDIEAFVRAGAQLDIRADWYGWTPLFFAASHDNEETFHAIVRHIGPNAYQSLDGDGWSLLHCCVYFGAPNIMKLVLRNGIDVNQKSLPAPLPEDPELSYKELTAADIATYIGPNRCQMFMNALFETSRDLDIESSNEFYWDTDDLIFEVDTKVPLEPRSGLNSSTFYGAEDIDNDRWTLLHWACYNGSTKVKDLLLLRGVDAEHRDAIMLEENPTLFPSNHLNDY